MYVDFKAVKAAIPLDRAAKLLGLEVKPSGAQLRAPCPACQSSDDRALALTPSKGVFFCHHAQIGGDVIALAGHLLGLSAKDAAEWLQDILPDQRDVTVPQKPEVGTNRPNSNLGSKPRNSASPVLGSTPPARTFDPSAFAAKLEYNSEVEALGYTEEEASSFRIGFHRGHVYIPNIYPSGTIAGWSKLVDGKLVPPRQWLPDTSNVVRLKSA